MMKRLLICSALFLLAGCDRFLAINLCFVNGTAEPLQATGCDCEEAVQAAEDACTAQEGTPVISQCADQKVPGQCEGTPEGTSSRRVPEVDPLFAQ